VAATEPAVTKADTSTKVVMARRSILFDYEDFKRVIKLAEDGAEMIHRKAGMVPFEACQHLECDALKRIQQQIREQDA
jgi:hypothetical protein